MTDVSTARPKKALIVWSLLCAAAIIASGLLQARIDAPKAWLWLVVIWMVGFFHWSRK